MPTVNQLVRYGRRKVIRKKKTVAPPSITPMTKMQIPAI